jgi:uncharacterized Tic20 family protein
MTNGSDSATAVTKAYTIINAAADKQAYYLSYLDTFRLIAVFFILVIPLVAFLRVKKKSPLDEAQQKQLLQRHIDIFMNLAVINIFCICCVAYLYIEIIMQQYNSIPFYRTLNKKINQKK